MSADPARLIDLAFDAIFAFGTDTGLITFWNRGAERLYGWKSAEALGKHPPELLQTQHPTTREDVLQILQRRGHWEGALIQRARDGRSVVVDARWVLDPEGQLVLEVNRDVTLAWQSTEILRGLERSRSEFIEQVAHQLRSPVTLLRGYVELLQEGRIDGPVDAEFAKALRMLYESAEEMHRVTERLVSASYALDRYRDAVEHAANAGHRGAVKIVFDLRGEKRR